MIVHCNRMNEDGRIHQIENKFSSFDIMWIFYCLAIEKWATANKWDAILSRSVCYYRKGKICCTISTETNDQNFSVDTNIDNDKQITINSAALAEQKK